MKVILDVLGVDENKDEKSFKFLMFLLIQFVLVCLNLIAGFCTGSMSLTACVGYHLATIFLVGDDVAKSAFPDTRAAKIGRGVVLVLDSIMSLGFSAIVINEFFVRVGRPVTFSDPIIWLMLAASLLSMVLGLVYASNQLKRWKEAFVPIEVFVGMILLRVLGYEIIDSIVGLLVSLFVVYLAIKMIVRAWRHRKSF